MADPFDTPGYRYALNRYPGDGSTTQWDISFAGVVPGYVSTADVQATLVDDETGVRTAYPLSPSNFILPTRLSVTPAVPVGVTLEIRRATPKDEPLLDYTDGALMIEKNLDTSNQQAIYVAAEMVDRFADALDETAEFSEAVLDRLAEVETVADNADAKADSAITSAAAANVTAANAVNLANTAIATANQAVEDVAGAEEAAILATAAADAANLAATNANAAADAATDTAAAALDTAEDAVTIANGATGTANNALSVANGIAATAGEALDTANDALDVANGIAATASEALDTANDAEALANSFEARVSAMEPLVNPILLPTTAHSLDDYRTRGLFMQNTTAGAVAGGASYPVAFAGTLVVTSAPGLAGNLLYQEYTVYGNDSSPVGFGGRTYKRSCQNQGITGTWSTWKEVARKNEVMVHSYLTVATDANTLTADNTYYSWASSTVVLSGSNWPALPSGYVGRGHLDVVTYTSTQVYQRLVLPLAAIAHPLVYERYGVIGGTWYGWKIAGPLSSTAHLPTADYGDIYVDGLGWYRWNGSAYAIAPQPLAHGQCVLNYISTTSVRLDPKDGDGLIINGLQYRIPAAGVALSNSGLSANTGYYVYAKDNGSGGVAVEALLASGNPHSKHTNGVEILTGDPTRTLVGWIGTGPSSQFLDTTLERRVASWFNRRRRGIVSSVGSATASASLVALSTVTSMFSWGDTSVEVKVGGYGTFTTGTAFGTIQINRNGTIITPPCAAGSASAAAFSTHAVQEVTEGLATYQMFGNVSAGTMNMAFVYSATAEL